MVYDIIYIYILLAVFLDWTSLFSTSHRCSNGLRSGDFGGHVKTFVIFLKPLGSNQSAWELALLAWVSLELALEPVGWPAWDHEKHQGRRPTGPVRVCIFSTVFGACPGASLGAGVLQNQRVHPLAK